MNAMLAQPPIHRFNIAEYEAMARHGILRPDDRVELITGEIVEMPPVGNHHIAAVTALVETFYRLLPQGAATIMSQQPIPLLPDSMPEPDVMLLRHREDCYLDRRATSNDVLLVVEVAEGTLRYDRTTKLRLYAGAGVSEYWIVNLNDGMLELYRDSRAETYASARIARAAESVAPSAFPECRLRVGAMLGLR
jgi:Uma2 family endonuclease